MAQIFLDTNVFIDILEKRTTLKLEDFEGHRIFISPLSIHIYTYLYKIKIPNQKLSDFLEKIHITPFTNSIAFKSLTAPTNDFEDNVQLHSAVESECNYFLTREKKLLNMQFFGKTKISNSLSH